MLHPLWKTRGRHIEKKSLELTLPVTVMLPRKTIADVPYRLNLNVYRNTCPTVLNQAKQLYHELIAEKLAGIASMNFAPPVRLFFTIYPARKCDLANVAAVVEKFAADAIVACQLITDDNCEVVTEGGYKFGGYDRVNPRVVFRIEEI